MSIVINLLIALLISYIFSFFYRGVKLIFHRKKYRLSSDLFESESYEDCIKTAKTLIGSDYELLALNLIGNSYFNLGDIKEAKKYYFLSIENNSDNPLDFLGFGECLVFEGNYNEAIDNIKKSIFLGYDNLDSKLTLADIYRLSGDTENLNIIVDNLSKDEEMDFFLVREGFARIRSCPEEKKDIILNLLSEYSWTSMNGASLSKFP